MKLLIIFFFAFILSTQNLFAQKAFRSVGLDTAMDASTSGMIANKIRMAIIAENVANVTTFKVEETGAPYKKKYAVMETYKNGVRVRSIEESSEPFLQYPESTSPQSDGTNISLPNVSIPDEMINMSYTEVMYEANTTCLKTAKAMYQTLIDTLK